MKKLMLLLLTGAMYLNTITAQPVSDRSNILSLVSGEQKLVRSAVDSSLCIIMQEYLLADSTGKKFVRDDKNYFGRSFTLGVITDSGVYASAEIIIPWKNDISFGKVKSRPGIVPVLSKTFYKRFYETDYKVIPDSSYSYHNDSAIVLFATGDSTKYIRSGFAGNDTTGWVVLLSTKINAATNEILPGTVYVMKPKTLSGESERKLFVPGSLVPDKENILGGAYFTWKASLGCISFLSIGIVKKEALGWVVTPFNKSNTIDSDYKLTLTPLK